MVARSIGRLRGHFRRPTWLPGIPERAGVANSLVQDLLEGDKDTYWRPREPSTSNVILVELLEYVTQVGVTCLHLDARDDDVGCMTTSSDVPGYTQRGLCSVGSNVMLS
jgi:hypothetical protein